MKICLIQGKKSQPVRYCVSKECPGGMGVNKIMKCVLTPLDLWVLVFCLLLKISLDNPYLNILDLSKLFVADTPMKKKHYFFC